MVLNILNVLLFTYCETKVHGMAEKCKNVLHLLFEYKQTFLQMHIKANKYGSLDPYWKTPKNTTFIQNAFRQKYIVELGSSLAYDLRITFG